MLGQILVVLREKLVESGVPDAVIEKIQTSEPPSAELGDIAIACFFLAPVWAVKPIEAATRVAEMLEGAHDAIAAVRVAGPYVNISVRTEWLVAGLSHAGSLRKKEVKTRLRKSPRIMFEYCQPNTHKEFHIGHMRNACYGSALVNIWRGAGRNVMAVTYNNDVGSGVSKTVWAYKKFHSEEKPPKEKGRWLAGMYVEATRLLEEHPEWKEEVSDVLRKLESGDKEWHKLWKTTRQWSLDEFKAIYKELGLKFDASFNESDIKERGHEIAEELLQRGIAKQSQGAVIMDFEAMKKGVLILRKSDGAGNYATSDLALAEKKFKKYVVDEAVIVTDNRQDLYFEQLFMTLQAYGFTQKFTHLSYDLVTLPEGAMSSRKGTVVLYESLRDEVVDGAIAETEKRHPEWSAKKVRTVAHALAIAAIKFTMVRSSPQKIIVFDKSEMLSFEGYTAPYLEYTLARISSIFKKAGRVVRMPKQFAWTEREHALWVKLARGGDVVDSAAAANDPSELARYCFELAKDFASYYENSHVLDTDAQVRAARLLLCRNIQASLSTHMQMLGLPIVSEM